MSALTRPVARLKVVVPAGAEPHCPRCGKRLGDSLNGVYQTKCPRCKEAVEIVAQ